METKNEIIKKLSLSVGDASAQISLAASTLNDNPAENATTIAILYVLVESLKSQTTLLTNALDSYGG